MAELRQRLAARISDRYAIGRELGRGGMAIVFLARDLRHGRDVALKVLRPEVGESLGADRFLREIRIVAGLTHPHLLPLHDSGEADGLFWFVMPYVRGESLRQRLLREGPLGVDEAVRIAGDVAAGLAHAHAAGIIHRDIKPENILLEGGEAMLADFGIARAINESTREGQSQAGLAVGTPHYMSPEQAAGAEHLDGRSDVYSLGCVLHEMLTGAPPFTGTRPQAILAQHRSAPPPPVQTLRPTVPPLVAEALDLSLRKLPADRHPGAAAFAEALDRARTTIVTSAGPASRFPAGRVLLGLAVAGLAAVAVLRPWRHPPMDRNRVLLVPLEVTGAGAGPARDLNRDVMVSLQTALGTVPLLTPVDAFPWLPPEKRDNPRTLSPADFRRAARDAGAGRVVWGTLILADSARLSLTLFDAAGDSTAGRVSRTAALGAADVRAAATTAWQLGLGAAKQLLPRLIPAGGRDAAPALAALDPTPAAAASFLLGERQYRAAHFDSALAHFEEAVALDSGFAMAAIRGAQAASWLEQAERAAALSDLALARDSALPPRLQLFAQGLQAYLGGRADHAAEAFRVAIVRQPDWAEAWTALGEVYEHLLPPVSQPDSLARDAFERAHRLDPGFLPPTYHLAAALIRAGLLARADSLIPRYAGAADPVQGRTLSLMAGCVRGGSAAEPWGEAAARYPGAVFAAAVSLAVAGLRQPDCAAGAWRAIVAAPSPADTAGRLEHGFAQVGLLALDVARGRLGDAASRYRADSVLPPGVRQLLPLVLQPLGVPLGEEAGATRRALAAEYGPAGERSGTPVHAWLLGGAAIEAGDRPAAAAALRELARRAQGGGRLEAQLANALAARVALAAGDTAAALAGLSELRPSAPPSDIGWAPWETLGAERLLLARLRLARGDTTGARLVASGFDAAAPIDLLYLRPSLEVRAASDPEARRRLTTLTRR